ncbi:hypothetical protein SNEBB_003960 [Seison nebaliae]|nr:hypothetical protein SNEBB_003960 [Seison nebaliae]
MRLINKCLLCLIPSHLIYVIIYCYHHINFTQLSQTKFTTKNCLIQHDHQFNYSKSLPHNFSIVRPQPKVDCHNFFFKNHPYTSTYKREVYQFPFIESHLKIVPPEEITPLHFIRYLKKYGCRKYLEERGIVHWYRFGHLERLEEFHHFPLNNVKISKDIQLNEDGTFKNFYYVKQKELEQPIVFSILISDGIEQLERLILNIFSPQNIYCVSVDLKGGYYLMSAIRLLSECIPNMIVAEKQYKVEWGEWSIVEAHHSCFKNLLKYQNGLQLANDKLNRRKISIYSKETFEYFMKYSSHQWNYLLDIAHETMPMMSVGEMGSFLHKSFYTNDIECYCPFPQYYAMGRFPKTDAIRTKIFLGHSREENMKYLKYYINIPTLLLENKNFYEILQTKERQKKFEFVRIFHYQTFMFYVSFNPFGNQRKIFILTLGKGSMYGAFRREFIQEIFRNPFVREFGEWVKDSYISDETFWSSLSCVCGMIHLEKVLELIFDYFQLIRSNKGNEKFLSPQIIPEINKRNFKIKFFKSDHISSLTSISLEIGDKIRNYSIILPPSQSSLANIHQTTVNYQQWLPRPCRSFFHHSMCVIGISDLYWVFDLGKMFINKFKIRYDPTAIYCAEKRLIERRLQNQIIEDDEYCQKNNILKCSKIRFRYKW